MFHLKTTRPADAGSVAATIDKFKHPDTDAGIRLFDDVTAPLPSRSDIRKRLSAYADNGIRTVVLRIMPVSQSAMPTVAQLRDFLSAYGDCLIQADMRAVLTLDATVSGIWFSDKSEDTVERLGTRVLTRREYYCDPNEHLNYKIHPGVLMALIAYDQDHNDTLDLLPYVKDGFLDYTLPAGNWTLEEYLCRHMTEKSVSMPDMLSHDACSEWIRTLTSDLFGSPDGMTKVGFDGLYVPDICLDAPNRRNWNPGYNRYFEERFGFSPAPYYAVLFHHAEKIDAHIRTLLMTARAELFYSSFLDSVSAFCRECGLDCITSFAASKQPAPSWLSGDMLRNMSTGPCAVFNRAYLYGINSAHLAAAADMTGSVGTVNRPPVYGDMFRDYRLPDMNTIYADTLHAMSRGINRTMIHSIPVLPGADGEKSGKSDVLGGIELSRASGWDRYAEFVSRLQSVLSRGENVCDIAVLYPIYAIHSHVYLYEEKLGDGAGFEFPRTPEDCNYMTLLNSMMTYCGRNATLIHPDTLSRCVVTPSDRPTLSLPGSLCRFSVVILPGSTVMSLDNMRVISRFFDEGGKIIAAGSFPTTVSEFAPDDFGKVDMTDIYGESASFSTPSDRELSALIRHVFGEEATDRHVIKDRFHNTNARGGEAFLLTPSATAIDGTEQVSPQLLYDTVRKLKAAPDLAFEKMLRFECNGAFSCSFSDFSRLGLDKAIPGKGMMSYAHRRTAGQDIYLVSNTTEKPYTGHVFLRGIRAEKIRVLDPHTGRVSKLRTIPRRIYGERYASVLMSIPACHGFILLADATDPGLPIDTASIPDVTASLLPRPVQRTVNGIVEALEENLIFDNSVS